MSTLLERCRDALTRAGNETLLADLDAAIAQQAEPVAVPLPLIQALRFYANGDHMILSDDRSWDTVSDEPQNWHCDEAGTATIEDGTIAAMALRGTVLQWEQDHGAPPDEIAGEAFASPQPPAAQPATEYPPLADIAEQLRGIAEDVDQHDRSLGNQLLELAGALDADRAARAAAQRADIAVAAAEASRPVVTQAMQEAIASVGREEVAARAEQHIKRLMELLDVYGFDCKHCKSSGSKADDIAAAIEAHARRMVGLA